MHLDYVHGFIYVRVYFEVHTCELDRPRVCMERTRVLVTKGEAVCPGACARARPRERIKIRNERGTLPKGL